MTVKIQNNDDSTILRWADTIAQVSELREGLTSRAKRPQMVVFTNAGAVGFHSFIENTPQVLDLREVATVEILGIGDYKIKPEAFKENVMLSRLGGATSTAVALYFLKKDGSRYLFSVNTNNHDDNLKIISALKATFDEAVQLAENDAISKEEFAAEAHKIFRLLAGEQPRAALYTVPDFIGMAAATAAAAFGLTAAAAGAPPLFPLAFFAFGCWAIYGQTPDLWRLVALRWLRLLRWPAAVQALSIGALALVVASCGAALAVNKSPAPWALSFSFLLALALLVGFVRCHKWAALGLLVGRPLERGAALFQRGHKWAHLFVFIMGPLALFGVASDFFGWIPSTEEQKLGHITLMVVVWLVVLYYGPAVFKEKG